jgi:hypothetical protein
MVNFLIIYVYINNVTKNRQKTTKTKITSVSRNVLLKSKNLVKKVSFRSTLEGLKDVSKFPDCQNIRTCSLSWKKLSV